MQDTNTNDLKTFSRGWPRAPHQAWAHKHYQRPKLSLVAMKRSPPRVGIEKGYGRDNKIQNKKQDKIKSIDKIKTKQSMGGGYMVGGPVNRWDGGRHVDP